MQRVHKYISPEIVEKMRAAIDDAMGNEVFFVGYIEDDLIVHEVDVAARGNEMAVPAIMKLAREADVVIHNHPSGMLTPSDADMSIAAQLDDFSVAFYIVNNKVTDIYVVVEPFQKKELIPLETEQIEALLKPGGVISSKLKGFEDRPQQLDMIDYTCQAFNQGKISIIEAGTGTGKTMAYLLPAIHWAHQNKERIVISTNTINLQEQLIKKDIPFLQKTIDIPFEAVLVKGRSNYVCMRKVAEIESDIDVIAEDSEKSELQSLVGWAKDSKDGSKADLSYIPSNNIWEKIASESDTCTRSKCKFFRECFVNKARRIATRAQILVVNHHLLFADLAIRHHIGLPDSAAVLPPYQRIIFDEAHHIEQVATSYFGSQITRAGISRMLNRLYRRHKSMAKGYLPTLKFKAIRNQKKIDKNDLDQLLQMIDTQLISQLDHLAEFSNDLLEQLFHTVRESTQESLDNELKIRLLPHVQQTLIINSGLASYFKDYIQSLKTFSAALTRLVNFAAKVESTINEDWSSVLIEIKAQAERIDMAADTIDNVVFQQDEENIRWLEVKNGYRGQHILRFMSSPLFVRDMMNKAVFDVFKTIVLTSATLTVDKKFDYLADRLGLDQISQQRRTELILPAPFDYKKQVVIAVPQDMPDPGHPTFAKELAKAIFKAVTISDGRAFILFTSYGLLHIVYQQLQESLDMVGLTPLKQGTASRHELLRMFKKDKTSVLFATDSFWEGVDVEGDALESVIITKLPFQVPSEPVIEARYEAIEKEGGNAFMEYAVPMAVLKFKQGFGRLIRRKTDRGSVIVFDNRILKKSYGKRFLRSLPECHQAFGSRDEVYEALKTFLS